jgi:hypothetical protein
MNSGKSDTRQAGLADALKTAPYLLSASLLFGLTLFFVPIAPAVLFIRFSIFALLVLVLHSLAWRFQSGALTFLLQIFTPLTGVFMLRSHFHTLPFLTAFQPVFAFLGIFSALLLVLRSWLVSFCRADHEASAF